MAMHSGLEGKVSSSQIIEEGRRFRTMSIPVIKHRYDFIRFVVSIFSKQCLLLLFLNSMKQINKLNIYILPS